MDISRHISKLLFSHDCVIVPGFGGFVSNYQPTRVNKVQHQFHPPCKHILFNTALTINDGLLANEIAAGEAISYEEALQELAAFSRNTLRALEQSKPVVFTNIGSFTIDGGGTIQFTQDHTINYLKDVYGMTSVVSPAVRHEGRSSKPVFKDRKRAAGAPHRTISVRRVAAAAVVVVLIAFVGINFSESRQFVSNQWSQLTMIYSSKIDAPQKARESVQIVEPVSNAAFGVSFPSSERPDPEVAEIVSRLLEELPAIDNSTEPVEENIAEAASAKESPASAPAAPAAYQRMYHLIAGSYERSVNATELMDSYTQKGFSPEVIGPADNGRYRVSIAAYLRKEDALIALEEVREKYNPNIWLLRH
jgi:nucleoid DNA-binding protein